MTPGLAVVLVGSRKDSETYVRSKKKGCAEAGIESYGTDLPETATEEEVLKVGNEMGKSYDCRHFQPMNSLFVFPSSWQKHKASTPVGQQIGKKSWKV